MARPRKFYQERLQEVLLPELCGLGCGIHRLIQPKKEVFARYPGYATRKGIEALGNIDCRRFLRSLASRSSILPA